MHTIYWAHSYRPEDAQINEYFGTLIEKSARMIVNFDPPSQNVNRAKLQRNLSDCDGMVAILSWRGSGPSPYIAYEIWLSFLAKKPVIAFVDDRLPNDILPRSVPQYRFSQSTYFHQVRGHTQALNDLKIYMGDPPPVRLRPSSQQRSCGIYGIGALYKDARRSILQFVHERGYLAVDLEKIDPNGPPTIEREEKISDLDLVLSCVNSKTWRSAYWKGAIGMSGIPSIEFTVDLDFPFNQRLPREFQPCCASIPGELSFEEVLAREFSLFEQDFLTAQNPEAINRYVQMQVEAGVLQGHYEAKTRNQFVEVVMGDKNIVFGQAGAVGRGAHVHDINFTQIWNGLGQKVDLPRLADELQRVHRVLDSAHSEPEKKLAAGAIAAAELSARQNDGPKVLEYLRMAGRWALDAAEAMGAALAIEALKVALGS
jgi:hypothetical protein